MAATANGRVLRAGELEVRPADYLAVARGRTLYLTARELRLLTVLVERQGRIVSREELYHEVWRQPYRKSDRSVDVYVARLRKKLGDAMPGRRLIHTHFGFGYRLAGDGRSTEGRPVNAGSPRQDGR